MAVTLHTELWIPNTGISSHLAAVHEQRCVHVQEAVQYAIKHDLENSNSERLQLDKSSRWRKKETTAIKVKLEGQNKIIYFLMTFYADS